MAGFTWAVGDMGSSFFNAKGAISREILNLVDKNPKVAYINSDGTGKGNVLEEYSKKYPHRVYDVGIQEMNMVTSACGMAKMGYIPYVQTFGPFLLFRAYDQVHNDICYNDFPVKLIGTHAGTSSGLGPTHNDIVDFAICNALPNMTVMAPCDAGQLISAIQASENYPHPLYIRVPRGEEPMVYPEDLEMDFQIGKANEAKEGTELYFIATGSMVFHAIKAAAALQEDGIDVGVFDMHTIKPLELAAVEKAARTGRVITVEDHHVNGGLGTVVGSAILEMGIPTKFRKIGIPDKFVPFGYPETIYPAYGMDAAGLEAAAREMLA